MRSCLGIGIGTSIDTGKGIGVGISVYGLVYTARSARIYFPWYKRARNMAEAALPGLGWLCLSGMGPCKRVVGLVGL